MTALVAHWVDSGMQFWFRSQLYQDFGGAVIRAGKGLSVLQLCTQCWQMGNHFRLE